jgi:Leucine-rich repeat (LRR) protein
LPAELGQNSALESVVVLNVPIKKFPYFLSSCPRLRRLVLRGTDISQVNDDLLQFPSLEYLDLTNNPLTQIPDRLAAMNLPTLRLYDTPFRHLTQEQ